MSPCGPGSRFSIKQSGLRRRYGPLSFVGRHFLFNVFNIVDIQYLLLHLFGNRERNVSSRGFYSHTRIKSTPVGAIAGGAAGGAAFLIAIIAIIWMVRRHAKKSRESRANTGFGPTSEIPEAYGGNDHDKTAMAQVTTMGSPYKGTTILSEPCNEKTKTNSY